MILFVFIAVFCFSGCSEKNSDANRAETIGKTKVNEGAQNAEPFAVVELFSSEGCSDCPPAEKLLNKITLDAMADKTYIYPLAFHIDYWNKLGWKDVFSDSSYSNRQRKYRKAFGNQVVYAPQMIINGSVEFPGGNETKAMTVIDSFLTVKPEWYFTIHPDESKLKDGIIKTEYEIINRPAQEESREYVICFALAERKLETDITRGENKGMKLQHENVVRFFASQKLKNSKGEFTINYTPGNIGKNHSLIAFIQDASSMKITGANLWNF